MASCEKFISLFPVDISFQYSYNSLPSIVNHFAIQLVDGSSSVKNSIYTGHSLGAVCASIAVALCETSLVQPRGLVMFDIRIQCPIPRRPAQQKGPEGKVADRLPERARIWFYHYFDRYRVWAQQLACVTSCVLMADHVLSDHAVAERFAMSSMVCTSCYMMESEHNIFPTFMAWDIAKRIRFFASHDP